MGESSVLESSVNDVTGAGSGGVLAYGLSTEPESNL